MAEWSKKGKAQKSSILKCTRSITQYKIYTMMTDYYLYVYTAGGGWGEERKMPLYLFTNIIIGFTVNCEDLLTHFREYIVNWWCCCCFTLVEYLFILLSLFYQSRQNADIKWVSLSHTCKPVHGMILACAAFFSFVFIPMIIIIIIQIDILISVCMPDRGPGKESELWPTVIVQSNFCCYSSGDRDEEEKDRHSSVLAKLLIQTDAIAAFHHKYDHLFPANESSNGHRSQINIKRLKV